VRRYVGWGAGPRAGQFLTLGAKARALLQGRAAPDLVDVRTLVDAVLRHRVVLNYEAEAARVGVGDVIGELVRAVDHDAR
jgi:MoxR-like ATPase